MEFFRCTYKFTKPFLYASIFRSFFEEPIILYNSRQMRPVTRAVVVAMAGIILKKWQHQHKEKKKK